MVDHTIFRKVVSIVATSMEYRDGGSICSYLWDSRMRFINPNSLRPTLNPQLAKQARFYVVQRMPGNGLPELEATRFFREHVSHNSITWG